MSLFTKEKYDYVKTKTIRYFEHAGIAISSDEKQKIEVTDFGLNQLEVQGLQLLTYVNNEDYCAKELFLMPSQTCPEHKHPSIVGQRGKKETFRCRYGCVFLYVEGEESQNIQAVIPKGSENQYTVFHEIILYPGDQTTIPPNTLHWFQSDQRGAIISEFSTTSNDEIDQFTDPHIIRTPKYRV